MAEPVSFEDLSEKAAVFVYISIHDEKLPKDLSSFASTLCEDGYVQKVIESPIAEHHGFLIAFLIFMLIKGSKRRARIVRFTPGAMDFLKEHEQEKLHDDLIRLFPSGALTKRANA